MAWGDKDRKGESGLEPYEFTVQRARFGYTDYNQGNTMLGILDGTKRYSDGREEEGHIWLKTGKQFEPAAEDGSPASEGPLARHDSGNPDKRFNANSGYMEWVKRALDLGAPLEDKSDTSLDIRIFLGSKFEVDFESRSGTIQGEKREWVAEIPVKYLGEVGSTASGSRKTTPAAANGDGPSTGDLLKLAKGSDDYVDFLEKATQEFGLSMDHPQLDERKGVWSKAGKA